MDKALVSRLSRRLKAEKVIMDALVESGITKSQKGYFVPVDGV